MPNAFEGAFGQASEALAELQANSEIASQLQDLAAEAVQTVRNAGRLLIAGNGGSMADAMHFAEECTGRFRGDRPPIAAIALADPTHLSCVANDFGFDQVFARLVRAFGRADDILILLSTSGNSPNLIAAAKEARSIDIRVTALLGKGGGELRSQVDRAILFPGRQSDRIQELHMIALHALVESLEARLGYA